jgi:hypothetical protein
MKADIPHSEFKSLLAGMVHLDAALARKSWARVMVVVLALTFTIVMTVLLASKSEVIRPDTREYLAFSPLRVFGYPIFLAIISTIADIRQSVVVAQTAIFLAASVFLSIVVLHVTRSLILALGLVVFLTGNIVVTAYNFIALTESLVTSLTMVALAALIQFYLTLNLKWFILLCTVAGLNIVIRPVGQVYLPFLILLIIYAWFVLRIRLDRMAVVFTLAVAISYGSIFVFNYAMHGFIGTNSNHGTGLLGKAIFLAPKHEKDFAGTPLDKTVSEISGLLTPVVTKLDQLEDTRAKILISQSYTNYLRFGVLFPIYRERYGHNDGWDRELYVRGVANAIVAKDPVGYLQLTWREFIALVILAPIMTSSEAERARADMDRLTSWPYNGNEVVEYESGPRLHKLRIGITKDQRCTVTVIGFRTVYYSFYIMGIASCLMMLIMAVQSKVVSWEVQTIGSAAVLYFGTVTMTALGDIGGVRYLVPIWPCIAVSWISAAHWVWKTAVRWRP